MSESGGQATFVSAIHYVDPKAALEWLTAAFGFETSMVITNPDGSIGHAEMRFGNGLVMIGGEWADWVRSPSSVGGANTQVLHVQLDSDVDAHCARSRAAGAAILREPEDQFYGDRIYQARDPEGHVWTFGQTIAMVTREEAEQASGYAIAGWR